MQAKYDTKKRVLDLFKLHGQSALIIGGNRGLGFAMASALAEAGASICIAARDEKINEAVAGELAKEYETEVIHAYCDVTSEQSVKDAVKKAADHFGKIDILINSRSEERRVGKECRS